MKKVLLTFFIGIIIAFTACNSTKQTEEQRILDSIRTADSLAMLSTQNQAIIDSINGVCDKRITDSLENCKKDCSKKNCSK